jgi:pyruvate kinase
MDAGMNVARFNFSHGDHAGHGEVLDRLRAVGRQKKRNVAVLLDTKGPEIRTGFLAASVVNQKLDLVKGDTLVLTTDYHYPGDAHMLACSYPELAHSVAPGQQILVADGSLVLTVLQCDVATNQVTCRVENNATLGERKNMNLPGVIVNLPTFTEKDVDDIVNFGIKNRVDFIAASFVRKASDVTNLRKLLDDNGGEAIKIICKIENQEGLENYNEILQETDAIMVARGDLGMGTSDCVAWLVSTPCSHLPTLVYAHTPPSFFHTEIPPAKVFLAQKMMCRQANIAGKPCIVATQMMESMIQNPRPTRAECSDVANAVYDGTDAVMLSGETANGPYFEQAVRVMSRTCCVAEASRNYHKLFQSIRNTIVQTYGSLSTGESMASSAVKTAMDIQAKLIVVLSETGKMANYVAKFRPGVSALCVTPNETAARQASGLLLGMHTVVVDSIAESEQVVEEICFELQASKMVQPGDAVVVIAGRMAGMKEQLRVVTVTGEETSFGHIVEGTTFFFDRGLLLSFKH